MKYFDYLKSILYIPQMNILVNSQKSTFSISADFFPLKVLKVIRNLVAYSLYNELKIIFYSTLTYRMNVRQIFWAGIFNFVTGP